MVPIADIILYGLLAGVLASGVLTVWPWARAHGRFIAVGASASLGFMAWYGTLNATDALALFNIDAPVIPLSWADAGSGFLAFVVSALALGLITERAERAGHVVGAAGAAGLVTTILDLFVV